jgi:hypothetical protein
VASLPGSWSALAGLCGLVIALAAAVAQGQAPVHCSVVLMVRRGDLSWINSQNTSNQPNLYFTRDDTRNDGLYTVGFPNGSPIQLPPASLQDIVRMNFLPPTTVATVTVMSTPVDYVLGQDHFLLLPKTAAQLQGDNPAGHFYQVREFLAPPPFNTGMHVWLTKTNDTSFVTTGISDEMLRQLNPGITIRPGHRRQRIVTLGPRQLPTVLNQMRLRPFSNP